MNTSSLDDLRKLSAHPAARILTQANAKLISPPDLPASATVPQVLAALADQSDGRMDMLQMLAHALPPREATWWACLAARDLGAAEGGGETRAVRAAEAWVRQPGLDTRIAAREAYDAAPSDDDTIFCAMAASFADGTLGPGQFDDYDAPPGAVGSAVFGMLLIAHYADDADPDIRGPLLLERGLNIARGGSGQIEPNRPAEALTSKTAP